MIAPDCDVVIIGTGATGVSAAFPLVEAGVRVMMIDPDIGGSVPALPDRDYLDLRQFSSNQWRWMLGQPQDMQRGKEALSPKFRVPTLAKVFADYGPTLGIEEAQFATAGSLASGGLTAAWGAGVSAFTDADLARFPISLQDLAPHYQALAQRIGLSGGRADAVSAHFGLDGFTDPPTPLDPVAAHVETRYRALSESLRGAGFSMGRARLAVLSTARHHEREACTGLGLCLWGCPRGAIYYAGFDLATLKRKPNLTHLSGLLVDHLAPSENSWEVRGIDRVSGKAFSIRTGVVILAAGVVSTTKLAMQVSGVRGKPVRLLSSPTAAFAMFFPALFGRSHKLGTGLAQHWFVLQDGGDEVCGGLFPTRGLPMAEFVSRAPVTKRTGIDIMRWILPATTVGNLFFHSRHSAHTITLHDDGRLGLTGGFGPDFQENLDRSAKRIKAVFRKLGALALPGSFTPGIPGGDVHYAGTLPMRTEPGPLETDRDGRLFNHPGLYIVDASVFCDLPAKSHTLTAMANAARIGERLARHIAWSRKQR